MNNVDKHLLDNVATYQDSNANKFPDIIVNRFQGNCVNKFLEMSAKRCPSKNANQLKERSALMCHDNNVNRSLYKIVSKFLSKTVSQYPDNNAPQSREKYAMILFLKSSLQENPLKIYPDKLLVTLLHNHNNSLLHMVHPNHNLPHMLHPNHKLPHMLQHPNHNNLPHMVHPNHKFPIVDKYPNRSVPKYQDKVASRCPKKIANKYPMIQEASNVEQCLENNVKMFKLRNVKVCHNSLVRVYQDK